MINVMFISVIYVLQALEGLPPELDFLINLAFNVLPIAQTIVIYLLLFVGLSGISWCLLKYFYYNFSESLSESRVSVKYMVVFPYIKREIAKLEEKDRLQKSDAV
jgi:Na+(H+)/acetate symporter ActP